MANEAAIAAVILRIQYAIFPLASILAKKISELVTVIVRITPKNKILLVNPIVDRKGTIQSSTRLGSIVRVCVT